MVIGSNCCTPEQLPGNLWIDAPGTRGPKWMGPANGGEGCEGVSTAATLNEAIAHALREEKAFCELFRRKKCVAVRGRDPATLLLGKQVLIGMRGARCEERRGRSQFFSDSANSSSSSHRA